MYADDGVVNVYAWSGVIPDSIIQQFEKETGIKVNFSTYDSNEVMYAKLKASRNNGYDIVEPSSYYIDRMQRQDLLTTLDKTKLTNYHNINPVFLNSTYDKKNAVSIPFIWGMAGIFFNEEYQKKSLSRWSDLWDARFRDQLLMLDDSREVFSMALKSLGYSANDENPDHIKEAYVKLKSLLPNIKIFTASPISMMIDEDATVGMVWNGDLYKASLENKHLRFIFPKEGFVKEPLISTLI